MRGLWHGKEKALKRDPYILLTHTQVKGQVNFRKIYQNRIHCKISSALSRSNSNDNDTEGTVSIPLIPEDFAFVSIIIESIISIYCPITSLVKNNTGLPVGIVRAIRGLRVKILLGLPRLLLANAVIEE